MGNQVKIKQQCQLANKINYLPALQCPSCTDRELVLNNGVSQDQQAENYRRV